MYNNESNLGGECMNRLKTFGILLIFLGFILYLAFAFFTGNETSSFGEFSSGLLLGLSIGSSLVGIILTVACVSKEKSDKKEENK